MSATALFLRRGTLAASLLVAAAVAWIGVVVVARRMGPMTGTMGLGLGSFVALWALMMTAMMLPSVTPFASLYTRTFGDRAGRRLVALTAGYLLVWTAAALPSFALAWLAGRALPSHPLVATVLAVSIFGLCGLYQLTPLKARCLARCRTPFGFVMQVGRFRGRWRDLRVGLYHGTYCLACCWALMALLVAFGLMNLTAMVVVTAAVLAEKAAPFGRQLSWLLGAASLALAVLVVFFPHVAPGLVPTRPGAMRMMSS